MMTRKFAFKSLSVSAAALAVFVLSAGVTVSPVFTSPAVAVTDAEPAPAKPAAKKKVRKKKKVRAKKKVRKRKKRRTRSQNFNSSSVVPNLEPYSGQTGFPHLTPAIAQIEAGEYRTAITTLNGLNRPDDANVLNLLGYSHRKLGLVDVGLRYYRTALEHNPQHKGVHEYLGEAYLQKDDLGKAEVMLGKLAQICGTDCKQYKELADAIAVYRAKQEL